MYQGYWQKVVQAADTATPRFYGKTVQQTIYIEKKE